MRRARRRRGPTTRAASSSSTIATIFSHSSSLVCPQPSCSTGTQTIPVSAGHWARRSRARGSPGGARCSGIAGEPAFVDRIGDEAADVGVHPAGRARGRCRGAAGRWRGRASRYSRQESPVSPGWLPLVDLGELHLVADQDEVARRQADGDRVGERDLAGLVDEQVVEPAGQLLAAEEPGGAADETARPSPSTSGTSSFSSAATMPCSTRGSSSSSPDLVEPAGDAGGAPAPPTTARMAFMITLWLCAVTPTRLPRREQLDDHRGRGVGLARARRALDAERACRRAAAPARRHARRVSSPARTSGSPSRWPVIRGGRRRSRSSTACEVTSPRSQAARVAEHAPSSSRPRRRGRSRSGRLVGQRLAWGRP